MIEHVPDPEKRFLMFTINEYTLYIDRILGTICVNASSRQITAFILFKKIL